MSELFFIVGSVLGLPFSIWVFFDARTRKNRSLGWSFLTFILGPFIALPLYFAYRNLKAEEVREGGTVWNIIRNYTLSWTVFIVVFIFASLGISENGEFIAYTIIVWLFITLCNYSPPCSSFLRRQESSEKTCPGGTPYNVSPAATMLLTGFLPSQE